MKVEIFNDGKQLQDIKDGEAWIQNAYHGVSTNDGHTWTEPNITIGIGTKDYWHCIIKFKDKTEVKDFIKRLTKEANGQ